MKALWQKFIAWKYHKYALVGVAAAVVILIGVIIALCVGGSDKHSASTDPSTSTGGSSMPTSSSTSTGTNATTNATTDATIGANTNNPTTAPTTNPTTNPGKPTTAPTTPSATTPVTITFASYNASEDAAFLPKNIFSEEMYVPGLVLEQSGQRRLDATGRTDVGAFVFKGEFGKCYEIKVPTGVPCVASATFFTNPRSLTAGDYRTGNTAVKSLVRNPSQEVRFMYNCRTYDKNEYLVIYTGTNTPIYIGERTIIADKDTQDSWYIPETVGSITSTPYSYTSEEFVNNLYEPLRNKNPNYITRSNIGKDATGQYNMYCYVFAPENYETTIFINGGTHGDEGVGYFALAKCMELIANAKPEDTLLYTMQQKVRFVVIPLVNVYSVSTNHSRYNGNSQDLNRDYEHLTQQESKNVMACFKQYAKDIKVAMDFHIANASPADAAVYFNFINHSDNAVVNYKTTNHMYQRYKELGYGGTMKDLSRVPGSYSKSNAYFEGRIWNEFGIPTITVEYLTTSTFPTQYTSKCMTLAVETYMNFIIQNSLFYLQK